MEEEPLCKAISSPTNDNDCEEAPGFVSHMLTFISLLLICVTFPLSLCWVVKVVQEYERVVVFRLGRMLTGKARGPGVFFIIPCIDVYEKIDLRTQTYDVPPQEVLNLITALTSVLANVCFTDPDQGQRDGVRECNHVLQGLTDRAVHCSAVVDI